MNKTKHNIPFDYFDSIVTDIECESNCTLNNINMIIFLFMDCHGLYGLHGLVIEL